jgi:carbon storage regulator
MLVLTRRIGEEIVIDGNIRIKVLEGRGDRVRLGITAPKSVRIDREEVHERRAEFSDSVVLDRVAKSNGCTPRRQKLIAVASSFSKPMPAAVDKLLPKGVLLAGLERETV